MKILIILTALAMILSCSKTGMLSSGENTHMYPVPDKLCALTFDDGPSADPELTPLVLDKLESYGVTATFFLVGENISKETGDIIDRMVKTGHEVGNHSWSYADMAGLSAAEVKKSVSDTTRVIKKYTGVTPVFFRPPNLSVSSTMFDNINLPFAGGVVAGDWPGGGGDSVENIMIKLKEGIKDGVIILLHDVQPKPHPTPEALDTLIPHLKKEGYEFVTLSELFNRKGIAPESGTGKMYVYAE